MSGTTNLNAPFIAAAQNQKEVTANSAFQRLDAAITETLAVSVSAGSVAPTAEEYRAAGRVLVSGATTAGRTLTLPVLKRPMRIKLSAASTVPISIVRGTSSRALLPGAVVEVYTDGTTNGLEVLAEYGPIRRDLWVRGVMDDDEILARWQVQEDSTLLPGLLGWDSQADIAATGTTVVQVRRDGTEVGTLTWAAAGTVPTLATSGGAAQSFTAGQFIDLKAPATADATLAGVFFNTLLMRVL